MYQTKTRRYNKMIRFEKEKITEAAEYIEAMLHEDVFGSKNCGYEVGDYKITAEGLLLRKDGYDDEIMLEAFKDLNPIKIEGWKEAIKLFENETDLEEALLIFNIKKVPSKEVQQND